MPLPKEAVTDRLTELSTTFYSALCSPIFAKNAKYAVYRYTHNSTQIIFTTAQLSTNSSGYGECLMTTALISTGNIISHYSLNTIRRGVIVYLKEIKAFLFQVILNNNQIILKRSDGTFSTFLHLSAEILFFHQTIRHQGQLQH